MRVTTMMMRIATAVVALALAIGTAGDADAQGKGKGNKGNRGGDPTLRLLDRNGDGFISRDEADSYRGGRFREMDSDGDGVVSRDEMLDRIRRRMEERFGERFDAFDENRDGRIDESEYRLRERKRFDALDRDGDGVISLDEIMRGND